MIMAHSEGCNQAKIILCPIANKKFRPQWAKIY